MFRVQALDGVGFNIVLWVFFRVQALGGVGLDIFLWDLRFCWF